MTDVRSGRIDVHSHSILPSYRKALESAGLGVNVRLPAWSAEIALGMMDRHGIAVAVTSLSVPGTHLGDDDGARDLARRCNDEAAELIATHQRLGAVATLPLPNVPMACEEAIRALDTLRLDGVGLLTGYGGKYLGHPDYDELLATLDQRSAVVTLHPNVHPSTKAITLGVPNFMLEYPFDTTRAAVNLLFSDVLDRFPNIKFILSHGGGTLPFLAWRVAAIAAWQMSQPPDSEQFLKENFQTALTRKHARVTPELIQSLLRRFWYDTALAPNRSALGSVLEVADAKQVLFGSDWPYAYETFVADEIRHVTSGETAQDDVLAGIERRNALTLFPRFAKIVAD